MRTFSGLSRSLFVAAAALCGVAAATDAGAYVRSYTPTGCHPVFWAQTCIYIQADGAFVEDMTPAAIESNIQRAIQSWTSKIERTDGTGAFLRLKYLPASSPRETKQLDYLQVIKFRRDKWARPPSDVSMEEVVYDPSATAITTVTFLNKPTEPLSDGKILDADIELNAVNNRFYDADVAITTKPGDGRPLADLWNTLTHELGHLMGLEHSCKRNGDRMPACTRDGEGNAVIACGTVETQMQTNAAYKTIYNTTMYPTASPMEVKKRQPQADDVAGVLAAYPQNKDPNVCKVPDAAMQPAQGGCTTLPVSPRQRAGAPLAGLSVLGVGLGLLIVGRRRRRARAGSGA